jgi:hypothetical protein
MPPGDNPISVNKYIIYQSYISVRNEQCYLGVTPVGEPQEYNSSTFFFINVVGET